jgi:formylglycine-generating enzyme required for sulfatase activity
MAKTRISKARISLRGISLRPRSLQALFVGLVALACLSVGTSQAGPIQWVTVGDPGNAADTNGRGAVATSFQIMKYELTNDQYTEFLNAVAKTDTYSLYNPLMGTNTRGGITRSGTLGNYSYAVRSNMGDKPVNYMTWFNAARVANWMVNGQPTTGLQNTGTTEDGAYTLLTTGSSGQPVSSTKAVPVNPGATYFIPTQDQWYKAAYYKGGSTDAGYWTYATRSDTAPTPVTADLTTGIGSAGNTGNFANFNNAASWNGETGNVTTVGTNGGSSYYGAFDMNGNVTEWNDLNGNGAVNNFLNARGGSWSTSDSTRLSSAYSYDIAPSVANDVTLGFRIAAVPEPSTWVMGLAGLACGAWQAVRRRRRAR